MCELTYGEQARSWANDLILGESRGPGDMPNAMRRLEARYGIPASSFFALRYRPVKEPRVGLYFRLHAAWQDFRGRQLKALQHETELTAKIAGHHHHSVVSAQAVLREAVRAGELTVARLQNEGDAP